MGYFFVLLPLLLPYWLRFYLTPKNTHSKTFIVWFERVTNLYLEMARFNVQADITFHLIWSYSRTRITLFRLMLVNVSKQNSTIMYILRDIAPTEYSVCVVLNGLLLWRNNKAMLQKKNFNISATRHIFLFHKFYYEMIQWKKQAFVYCDNKLNCGSKISIF